MYSYMRFLMFTTVLMLVTGCASGVLTVIPRSGGSLVPATFEQGTGECRVSLTLPTGESMKGRLTWIPPGGSMSVALLTTQNNMASGTAMSSGNTGMYIGSLVGENSTTMRIELLCNTWTMNCVGVGQTSSGIVYDIQK